MGLTIRERYFDEWDLVERSSERSSPYLLRVLHRLMQASEDPNEPSRDYFICLEVLIGFVEVSVGENRAEAIPRKEHMQQVL